MTFGAVVRGLEIIPPAIVVTTGARLGRLQAIVVQGIAGRSQQRGRCGAQQGRDHHATGKNRRGEGQGLQCGLSDIEVLDYADYKLGSMETCACPMFLPCCRAWR